MNEKLGRIAEEVLQDRDLTSVSLEGNSFELGIISSGVSYSILKDVLRELSLDTVIPVLKLCVPYPFPGGTVSDFCARCNQVLYNRNAEPVIEIADNNPDKTFSAVLQAIIPEKVNITPRNIYSSIKFRLEYKT